jgi:hypothetical protein
MAMPVSIPQQPEDQNQKLQEIANLLGLPTGLNFQRLAMSNATAEERLQLLYFLAELPILAGEYRKTEEARLAALQSGVDWKPNDLRKLMDEYQMSAHVKLFDTNYQPLYQEVFDRLLNGMRILGRTRYFLTLAHYKLEQDRKHEYELARYEPEMVFLPEPCPRKVCGQKKLWGGSSIVTRGDEGGRSRVVCQACGYIRWHG